MSCLLKVSFVNFVLVCVCYVLGGWFVSFFVKCGMSVCELLSGLFISLLL